jgi:hypothetical protein
MPINEEKTGLFIEEGKEPNLAAKQASPSNSAAPTTPATPSIKATRLHN